MPGQGHSKSDTRIARRIVVILKTFRRILDDYFLQTDYFPDK